MSNLVSAFRDTWDILAFRIASSRRGSKVVMVLGVLGIMVILYNISHMGGAIRLIAGSSSTLVVPGSDQTYASVVLGYLRTFTINNSIYAVSGVLVAMLGSLVLIPLSGYSYAGVIPSGDLITIKRTDYHIVTDSIVLQFVSFVALIQLGFLTFLSAILTLAAAHPGRGIVAGAGLWVIVVLLTSTMAWVLEYLHRRFGAWSKYTLVVVLAAVAGLLVLIAPQPAFELFGLSPAYTAFIGWLDKASLFAVLGVVAVFLLICWGLVVATQWVGNAAIGLQEKPRRRSARRHRALFGILPEKKRLSQVRFLLNLVIHQRNIFRPLVFAVVSLNVSLVAVGGNAGVLYALPAIIPLIVSLSWGVNTFGIIGGGTVWLVSQPRSKRTILYNIALVQLLMIVVVAAVTVALEIFVYHIDWPTLSTFLITTAAVSAYMTRSALDKAVKSPERYKVHIRGEQVLPPGKGIWFVARFFAGGAVIIGLMFIAPNVWVQLALLVLITLWSLLRLRLLSYRWNEDPDIVQHIISTVGY